MAVLPQPRGALTTQLFSALREPVHTLESIGVHEPDAGPDPLIDEDFQLALYACYELHYRGFVEVDDRWEWEPSLLGLRRELERRFESALRAAVPPPEPLLTPADELDLALRDIADRGDSELSRFIAHRASLEELREFIIHRSAYQLKEADPHSWAIPRLSGRPKAALVEIQADEYGAGRPDRIHAELYAKTMSRLGLDSSYGAYLDRIPAVTLASVNVMSMLGLSRRWRGAIVGHLALFEMSSSIPNRRYGAGLRRLGFDSEATDFFDEHVTADAVHENIAAVDLAGGLAAQDPALVSDILWGASVLVELDRRLACALLTAWGAGETLLLPATPGAVAPDAPVEDHRGPPGRSASRSSVAA